LSAKRDFINIDLVGMPTGSTYERIDKGFSEILSYVDGALSNQLVTTFSSFIAFSLTDQLILA
jgi:hypothetical protein